MVDAVLELLVVMTVVVLLKSGVVVMLDEVVVVLVVTGSATTSTSSIISAGLGPGPAALATICNGVLVPTAISFGICTEMSWNRAPLLP